MSKTVFAQMKDIDVYDFTGDSLFNIGDTREDVVVLVFDQLDCPYVDQYQERLVALQVEFSSVNFVYVNSDQKSLDRPHFKKIIKERLSKLPENTPYLLDRYSNYLYQFGVQKSPEVVVVYEKKVVYKGGIDDNPLDASDVHKHHLLEVLSELKKNGKSNKRTNKTAGCMITRDE